MKAGSFLLVTRVLTSMSNPFSSKPLDFALFRRGLLAGNVKRTHRFPCAKRVTWTRHYAMIRHRKALILLTLRRMTAKGPIRSISCVKKPANELTQRAFGLVAGARNSHHHRLPPFVVTIRSK